MSHLFLGIGSNTSPEHYVRQALDALQARLGALEISSVYESEAVGFDGTNFLNLVVAADCNLPLDELSRWLKQLEADNGRRRDTPKFSPRTLDVDILAYGDLTGMIHGIELPRAEILTNAFVLQPLAEIAPEVEHPVLGRPYGELWGEYRSEQKLWPVPFVWRGRKISPRGQGGC
ncbi:2-amino-4-hydroxy-6-hydroxymethyldihydropteridine diphosphokinase [Marinobacteraceae bacterium S3BR75-40.1]